MPHAMVFYYLPIHSKALKPIDKEVKAKNTKFVIFLPIGGWGRGEDDKSDQPSTLPACGFLLSPNTF